MKTLEFEEDIKSYEFDIDIKKTSIKALKKQIPFKPKTDKLIAGVGRCKCKCEFLDKDTNYCGNCGQRLNWIDKNLESEVGK